MFEPGGGGKASLAKGAQPSLKYEIIGRNGNDTEKSEQCSKVTRKLIESNKLGGGLGAESGGDICLLPRQLRHWLQDPIPTTEGDHRWWNLTSNV